MTYEELFDTCYALQLSYVLSTANVDEAAAKNLDLHDQQYEADKAKWVTLEGDARRFAKREATARYDAAYAVADTIAKRTRLY